MTFARAIIFTLVVPGTIVVILPHTLAKRWNEGIDLGPFGYCGLVCVSVGAIIYALSAFAFLVSGKGTPAIWFTKPLRFLLGEQPAILVRGGPFRWSRNPMYLGVVTIVLGEAVFFQKPILFAYTTLLWLFFHLIIIFVEEPHLRKKHGEAYESFCRAVPRWFGIRKSALWRAFPAEFLAVCAKWLAPMK